MTLGNTQVHEGSSAAPHPFKRVGVKTDVAPGYAKRPLAAYALMYYLIQNHRGELFAL